MQQQGGGSQYGASPTEMAAAAGSATDPGKSMLAGSIDHAPHQQQQQFKLGDPSLAAAEVEAEAEAASPISSRPPTIAHSSTGSFEEIGVVPGRGGLMPDEDTFAGVEEADRGGGNRWPRQETLALIKIRSDMDAAFRDATLKGPLWEDVSRKLAELGCKRSAKKCKEKFENVHKYYKRTKEGRAGRQDGKSYRFFSQLEALGATTSSSYMSAAASSSPSHQQQLVAAPLSAASIGIGITNPMPVVSPIRIPPLTAPASAALPEAPVPLTSGTTNLVFPPDPNAGTTVLPPAGTATTGGISFSSDSFSSSSGSEELDDEGEAAEPMEVDRCDVEGEQTSTRHRLKRKRGSSKLGSVTSGSQWMMEFFEGLMKQVMQKQEAMQQRFLETIEKREQDRMIREEAWKRQEMARLARENDLMARDRAMSASRDAAIIAFLQKITGQTIQLPPPVSIPAAPPPPPPTIPNSIPQSPPRPPPPPPQQSSSSPSQRQPHKTQPYQQHQHQQQQTQHYQQQQNQQQLQQQQLHHYPYHSLSVEVVKPQQNICSEVVMAVPEQQVPPQEIVSGGASSEASPSSSSSRWPKAEVLDLIRLRSGLESRYQEAGPKGPLWEEISAGMLRMGYKRNAKRCKEKWENINKYFKKVKESNKARPADAKTCPYFHELDALYRKKILGSGFSSSGAVGCNDNMPEQQHDLHHQQETLTSTMDPIPPPSLQERTDVQTTTPSSQLITQPENQKGSSSDLQTSNGGLTKVLFGEGSCTGGGGTGHTGVKKPEDIMKEQQQKQKIHGLLIIDCDKTEEPDSDNLDQDEDEEEEDEEEDYDEEEMKMAYKIEFQRQNAGSSSGEGNGAPSFLAIVR